MWQAREDRPRSLLMAAAGGSEAGPRAPGMCRTPRSMAPSPQPAEPSEGALLFCKTKRLDLFFPAPAWCFRAVRGAAAPLLRSGRGLTATAVCQDGPGLLDASPFAALTAVRNPSFLQFPVPPGETCSLPLIPLPPEASRASEAHPSRDRSRGVLPNFWHPKNAGGFGTAQTRHRCARNELIFDRRSRGFVASLPVPSQSTFSPSSNRAASIFQAAAHP